ncbi:MAG: tetratricopeptide repeat protein, partial [Vicinamibacterales bacterium]
GIQFRHGNTGGAAAAYEEVLKEIPTHGESLNNLAWILSEYRQDYSQALALADRALAVDERNPHFRDTRAAILERMPNRSAEAVGEYEKAAQLAIGEPGTAAKAWLRAARILARSDPLGAAVRAENALDIDRETAVLDDAQRAEIAGILEAASTDKK